VSATKSRHFTIRFSNRRIYRIFSPSRAIHQGYDRATEESRAAGLKKWPFVQNKDFAGTSLRSQGVSSSAGHMMGKIATFILNS
jgi:hypothetical protein